MKVLGIIPARGGSKGVPRKNIKKLNGKPLVQYTSEVALASDKISTLIVSSDDDEIIAVSKALGIEAPLKLLLTIFAPSFLLKGRFNCPSVFLSLKRKK